jgi:hypothetical protein
MRRLQVLAVRLSVAVACGAALTVVGGAGYAVAARAVVPAVSTWGSATFVPGLGVLNSGGSAGVESVSCASTGSCAAVGNYTGPHGRGQGFTVSERNGKWGRAAAVPGLAALNVGGGADVLSVSCASAGNCAAGGYYSWNVAYFRTAPFVATERGGKWSRAVAPPNDGYVESVSCPSPGNCLAGGQGAAQDDYEDNGNALIISESAGTWGKAGPVAGISALEGDDSSAEAASWITSVDCASAGNCAIGGNYVDGNGNQHGFVADEVGGVWGNAIEVPGLSSLSSGTAGVSSVSCGSAGNCAAGGSYTDSGGHQQAFVAIENAGAWGAASEVPGLGSLNAGGDAAVNSVSCRLASSCAVGGYYRDGAGHQQGFVATELDGAWAAAIEVPGLGALNAGGSAAVKAVSCATASMCTAGGFYSARSGHRQGFMITEQAGTWATASQMRRLEVLNIGGSAEVTTVSCPASNHCSAAGNFVDRHHHRQGFVTQGG